MRSRMAFYFSEALRSLSTNKATSFAAVIAMLVALLIVGITAAGFLKARALGESIQRDASIVNVFLPETVTEQQVNALRADLEANPSVERVEFVSKDDALERARELFKENPGVLENLPGNPFPASLDAVLVDPKQSEAVAKSVAGQPGVDSVEAANAREKRAIKVAQIGAAVLFALGVGILVAATVLIANTIRLSIYSRRREIEVMKLVGASNSFVRMPFMIEGFLCGVFASLLAMLAVYGLVEVLAGAFGDLIDGDGIGSQTGDVPLGLIAVGLLGLGVTLGMLGSATSMRKYLRT